MLDLAKRWGEVTILIAIVVAASLLVAWIKLEDYRHAHQHRH
jgi:hypothetical protein